jgi:hypothetical protein
MPEPGPGEQQPPGGAPRPAAGPQARDGVGGPGRARVPGELAGPEPGGLAAAGLPAGRDELREDSASLVAALAGRRYGMRPVDAKRRLLAGSGQCPGSER